MLAFILATDFDFIAYMSKMAFFWKLLSRQWRFWNMIIIHDDRTEANRLCTVWIAIYISKAIANRLYIILITMPNHSSKRIVQRVDNISNS